MESRTKNAKANIISGLANKIVFMLLPFITRTCIIYGLGTIYLGLNSLFASVLQLLSLAELGFGEALVFSMYAPLAKGEHEKVCSLLNLYHRIYRIIGCVILILGICFIPFLENVIKGETPADVNIHILYLIYLFNTVISYWMFAYKNSILAATQKLSITNNINTITQIALSVIQIALILIFKNYYLFVIVIPLCTIVRNIIIHKVTQKMYPMYFCAGQLEKCELTEIKKRVAGMFIYKLCGSLRSSFNSIIISSFIGLVILAKYENYFFIISSIMGVMTLISSGIVASIGNSIATESVDKNYNDFLKFFFMYEVLTSWCTSCLLCLMQPFMRLWVGEELMMSDELVILFCIYFYLLKTGDICFVYRQATGIWWKDKYRPIIESIINLGLNIYLVQKIGVAGVLISAIITLSTINFLWGGKILYNEYFKRSMKKYLWHACIYLITTVLVTSITYTICNMISEYGYMDFVIKTLITSIISALLLFLIYRNHSEFINSKKLLSGLLKISNRRIE